MGNKIKNAQKRCIHGFAHDLEDGAVVQKSAKCRLYGANYGTCTYIWCRNCADQIIPRHPNFLNFF